MNVLLDIQIGIGFANLQFGCKQDEVEQYFGKPTSVEIMNEGEGYDVTVWHYDLGFSIFFDDWEPKRFVCVDVDAKKAILWGKNVFEMKEHEIIGLFKKQGMYLYEVEEQAWGEKRLSFDEANVDFYFENGELLSVYYGIIKEGAQTLILPN